MTEYNMEYFDALCRDGDFVNAIEVWDYFSEQIYDFITSTKSEDYNPLLPPVFSSFMPKSGGTFLFNRMIQSLGYVEGFWGISKFDSHADVYPVPGAIRTYRRGGLFCHTHARPRLYFQRMIREANVEKFWLHVRHPADVVNSSYYHYQGEGQGEAETGEMRRARIIEERKDLKLRHGYTFDDRNAFFREHLGFYTRWLEDWVEFATSRPGLVVVTFFDDLATPAQLLTDVFARLGHVIRVADIPSYLPDDRLRKHGETDWKFELSAETVSFVEESCAIWEQVRKLSPKTQT